MSKDTEHIEFVEEKKETRKTKSPIKGVLDGSVLTNEWFVKQLPYIIFLVVLAFFYIGNRYHAERIVRKNNDLQKEINDLRAESITIAAELMLISKQSEVARQVKERGLDLEESLVPPKKIEIN
jgi:hypothetical protein